MASYGVAGHLVAALRGLVEFRLGNHAMLFKYGQLEIRLLNNTKAIRDLAKVMGKIPPTKVRRIWQRSKTGPWISVQTPTVIRT